MSDVTISNIEASFQSDQDWIGEMSPYLVFVTPDGETSKTESAEDAGESASWSEPVQLRGSGSPIKARAVPQSKVTAKASKAMRPDKTIGAGTVSTEYAGSGPQTVTLVDDDGNNVGEVTLQIEGGSGGGGRGGVGYAGGDTSGGQGYDGGQQQGGYGGSGGGNQGYGGGGGGGEYGGKTDEYGSGGGGGAEYGGGQQGQEQYGTGSGYGESGEQRSSGY